jgi:hypothetical protein
MENPTQLAEMAAGLVADSGQPAATVTSFLFEVVRQRGHWRVLHIGKHSLPHHSQQAALDYAMKLALEKEAGGLGAAVRLLRTDGQVFVLHPVSH